MTVGARGSPRNSRGDAPTSKPSMRTGVPFAPEQALTEPLPESPRFVNFAAAVGALVSGGERLRDGRGGAENVDDDPKLSAGRLPRRKGDVDAHPPTTLPGGHRADQDVLLPAPEPGDGRLVLGVRTRHLPGLHGVRAGRDPVPGARRQGAGPVTGDPGRAARLLRGAGRARDEDPDRDQCPRLPDQPRAGLEPDPGLREPVRERRPLRAGRAGPGRVVSPDHGCVPAREHHPPRDEHARSLVRRRACRAGDRARAVSRRLHRVGARRLRRARSLLSPNAVTVGASGAIFGILGAALVLEAQGSKVLGGRRSP